MLFSNRKQNRRSNRSQPSQRRKSTTRRLQLLEKLEDRRLMAVAGGFEEQLLRFELNRGEYSRSLRDQVQQDRYRSGRFELRRTARTAPAQQVDNSATDIQQPGQNEQPASPDGDEKKPEIEKKSGDANEPNGGNETKSDSSPEVKDSTDEATAKLNELKSDAADSVTVDEIDVSELSQPPAIFEGVEWNLDRRLRTGRDAGRSRQRTDPKDELGGGEDKTPKVENENPGQEDPTEENGGNEESSRRDLTPEELEVLRKESGFSEDEMNELINACPGEWPLEDENQDPQTEPAGGTGPGEAITPEDPATETPGDSGNDPGEKTGPELGVGIKNNPNPLGNVPAKGDGQQPLVPVNPNNGAQPPILADMQKQRADLQQQYQENERQQREIKLGDDGIVVDEVAFISLLEEMHYLQDRLSELDEWIEAFILQYQEAGQGANVANVISADQIGDLMQDLKSDDPQVREKAADTLFKALQKFNERLGVLGNLSDADRQFIIDFVEQFAATDQQTRDVVVGQLRKYIVENELSSIGGMSILESQLREHGKDFQLPDYVTDPGTDGTVDEGGNGDNGPGKDGGEKPGQELENGNQKNENPVGDVPAKHDEGQPPVAGNQNNGAVEQTLEELQKKREELQRQHQENERQQRELDQQGELGAAEDAELRRLLDEMHNLRDQLEELDKKIGGITSQSAVNGQEDPAGENPGDAEQPQKLNFSPEEKEAFRRQFGLSEDQMDELLEKGSLQDKGRIFSVFEHADGPPLILVTEPDPGPAVDNPNDKEEKAGTPEDQKSDQEGNGDKPDDCQEPKDPDNGKKQGALDGDDKLAAVDPAATDAVFARAGSSSSPRFERWPSRFQPVERGTDVTGPLSAVMTGTNAAATREAERLAGRALPSGNRAARIARKEAAAMRGIADVTTKADKVLNAANAVVNAVDEVRTSEAQSVEGKTVHGLGAGAASYLIGKSGPLVAVDVATNGEVTRTTNEAAENAALALDAVTGKATPQQVRERREGNRSGKNGAAAQLGENLYDNIDHYSDRTNRGNWRTRNGDNTMPNGAINWTMHHLGEMAYDRWASLFGDD